MHELSGEDRDSGVPVTIPQWLVLSGVSAQAVMLYCLYKIPLARFSTSRPSGNIPQKPVEFAEALHLDTVCEYQAVHQELLTVGAVEEKERVDEDGHRKTLILINELSPAQKVEEEKRQQQYQEWRASVQATPPVVKKGFIYLIRAAGSRPVKIGYSAAVDERIKNLQKSNPNQLELLWHTPGDLDLERTLHAKFHKYRIHGEWFDFGRWDPVKQVERAVQQLRDQ